RPAPGWPRPATRATAGTRPGAATRRMPARRSSGRWTPASGLRRNAAARRSAQRRLDLRQQLEQVAHQPDVRDLEDRRVRVLVDRDDRAGVLDAGQVLDRAADADRDVQLG